jgi:acetolactate synthase-1/2/3 large subunit
MAAESYARVTGHPGLLQVTTGPGGVNSLNGIFGAWTDSIPIIVISGQVKRETLMATYDMPKLRQLGDQEVDIIRMVKGITKYAALVDKPESIRYHLEKAMHLAVTGRPGPVWLDIPIDVQSSMIEPKQLKGFDPNDEDPLWQPSVVAKQVSEVLSKIKSAKRPVLMVGSGVHLAGALPVFERVIEQLNIPVVTAWTAPDLIASDHRLFCGRPGTIGDRTGNFVVQNSDLLLVIGSRLNIRQISYNWKAFAREAYKIQVDIDAAEMEKPTVKIDMKVVADAKFFLEELERQLDNKKLALHSDWVQWGKDRLARYPWVLDRQRQAPDGFINSYHFVELLFERLENNDVVVCGDGTASVVPFQVGKIKRGQRLYANSGDASMGYDLPASVGAAIALEKKQRVICLAGDGSIQLNIQELQTVAHHKLPIKIFVLNNNGYLSMRLTQDAFFKLRVGAGADSGVSFPDMLKLAQAYGIPARRWNSPDQVRKELPEVLKEPGPTLIEVMLDPAQGFEPKTSSKQLPDGTMYSAPLEDLAPFLSKEELADNMIIPYQKPD